MKKRSVLILITLLLAGQAMAQDQSPTYQLWKLTSYSGAVGVTGFYRDQYRTLQGLEEHSTFPYLMGNILLNTKSYVGHPNLLLLEVGGEYNPGSSQQFYTVSPDRSEVLTYSRLNLRGTFFNGKPMSFGGYYNLSRNYINREYVSSTRTDARDWGLFYNFRNKILPLAVTYSDRKWDQLEIETGRTYKNKQTDLQARVYRSFTKYGDSNELRYNYYTFFREDQNFIQTSTNNQNIIMNNTFYFDEHRKYMFRSSLNSLDQTGNITQNRFQAFETVRLQLPYRLTFGGNYDYMKVKQPSVNFTQQRINVTLDHELYASLQTGVFYEYYGTKHSAYGETNTRAGVSINYIKKIPTGTLNLGYQYRIHHQNVESDPNSIIQVFDEPHVLIDGQIVLLDRPYIDLASIVVKDATGSVFYQIDFDYILVTHDAFVEVQRVPGGQIPNNGAILVDYTATQVGDYNFDANFQTFTARVVVLNRLLDFYYTLAIQDNNNIEGSDYLTLNYFTRNVYGMAVNFWMITTGVEYDDYNSTIVPYKKMRYYLRLNGKIGKKVRVSMNGDLSDLTLTETNTDQLYANVYGKAIYMIKPNSKLDFDIGYRKQVGDQIDLDLITSRIEYNYIYRYLNMKVGVELYKRNYVGEKLNFKGVYFQIERRF